MAPSLGIISKPVKFLQLLNNKIFFAWLSLMFVVSCFLKSKSFLITIAYFLFVCAEDNMVIGKKTILVHFILVLTTETISRMIMFFGNTITVCWPPVPSSVGSQHQELPRILSYIYTNYMMYEIHTNYVFHIVSNTILDYIIILYLGFSF